MGFVDARLRRSYRRNTRGQARRLGCWRVNNRDAPIAETEEQTRFASRTSPTRLRVVLRFSRRSVLRLLCETFRVQKQKSSATLSGHGAWSDNLTWVSLFSPDSQANPQRVLPSLLNYGGGALATGISALHSVGTSILHTVGCSVRAKSLCCWWWQTHSVPALRCPEMSKHRRACRASAGRK